MDEPVVETLLCRLLANSTKMAATTASMRIRPAIAMPMAKLLCDMQMLFGSSIVCKCKFNLVILLRVFWNYHSSIEKSTKD